MTDFFRVKGWRAALLAMATLVAPAHAETFPSKTIRIIVPYAPGGSIDLTARVIAKNLQDSAGQNVIVENKPGANAAIGIETLMRSDPDGHTLVILSDSPVTINVHLSRLNYDPLTDLVPISKVVSSPIVLAANPKAGIASIADLVQAAKAKPLSYGVAGRGSSSGEPSAQRHHASRGVAGVPRVGAAVGRRARGGFETRRPRAKVGVARRGVAQPG